MRQAAGVRERRVSAVRHRVRARRHRAARAGDRPRQRSYTLSHNTVLFPCTVSCIIFTKH